MSDLLLGQDGKLRCAWAGSEPDYLAYHDSEWGFPVGDDSRLFEKICLEGFQSGLSWLTILRRREGFRKAFYGFDIGAVGKMNESDVDRLLEDAKIIRHRGKIEATINNARCAQEVIASEGSFAAFVWRYQPDHSDPSRSISPESVFLARDLKERGFRFVGPTTAYAFMQSMGLVNDHLAGCFVDPIVGEAVARFVVPHGS